MISKTNNKLCMFKITNVLVCLCLLVSSVYIPTPSYAQSPATILNLPAPGMMVSPTGDIMPVLMKGIKIYPDEPLQFDFIMDTGSTSVSDEDFEWEASKLIKYFMASLTVPQEELWVNLSPFEKNRIIPEAFGFTMMGRDMLAQDYILKQLTATLMYPEEELGEEFWSRIYEKASDTYEIADIPVNTFNKVWIVPDKAVIYESGDVAYIKETHLKVMLESDYLALQESGFRAGDLGVDKDVDSAKDVNEISSQVMRDVILPAIEKEVNEGENFQLLRQIYSSFILASWFKRNLQESLLGQVYVEENKINGIDIQNKNVKQEIYEQYLEAFKVGVYDYIKEEYDPISMEIISRKYFSGGTQLTDAAMIVSEKETEEIVATANQEKVGDLKTVSAGFVPIQRSGGSLSIIDDDRDLLDPNILIEASKNIKLRKNGEYRELNVFVASNVEGITGDTVYISIENNALYIDEEARVSEEHLLYAYMKLYEWQRKALDTFGLSRNIAWTSMNKEMRHKVSYRFRLWKMENPEEYKSLQKEIHNIALPYQRKLNIQNKTPQSVSRIAKNAMKFIPDIFLYRKLNINTSTRAEAVPLQYRQKKALIVFPEDVEASDHNMAFDIGRLEELKKNLIDKDYEVIVKRLGGETSNGAELISNMMEDMEDYGEIHEDDLDLVVLGGHGSPNSITLSAKANINRSNIGDLKSFNKYLRKGAVVALRSCSTGANGQRNIANDLFHMNDKIGRFIAPSKDSRAWSLVFDSLNNVVDIDYLDMELPPEVEEMNRRSSAEAWSERRKKDEAKSNNIHINSKIIEKADVLQSSEFFTKVQLEEVKVSWDLLQSPTSLGSFLRVFAFAQNVRESQFHPADNNEFAVTTDFKGISGKSYRSEKGKRFFAFRPEGELEWLLNNMDYEISEKDKIELEGILRNLQYESTQQYNDFFSALRINLMMNENVVVKYKRLGISRELVINYKIERDRQHVFDVDQIMNSIELTKDSERIDTAEIPIMKLPETAQRLVQDLQKDNALPVGGIDFNPDMLEIETEGEGISRSVMIDMSILGDLPISGFSPIILSVVPTNLYQLVQ